MNKAGFTVIELLVVIAIIGALLSIGSINFSNWQRKSQIESRTREIFNDFNEARLNSIYMKRRHSLVFEPDTYVMKRYSSENEKRTTGGTVLVSKKSSYLTSIKDGTTIFEFDIRGFTDDLDTIYVNPVASGAVFDCIVISDGRTNMGRGVDSDNDGQPNSCTFK
jgi:prepilin-type N-terminal cleavage/methylation domain-containing protein